MDFQHYLLLWLFTVTDAVCISLVFSEDNIVAQNGSLDLNINVPIFNVIRLLLTVTFGLH